MCVSLGLDVGGERVPYDGWGEEGALDRNYAHTIDAIARQLEDARTRLALPAPATEAAGARAVALAR